MQTCAGFAHCVGGHSNVRKRLASARILCTGITHGAMRRIAPFTCVHRRGAAQRHGMRRAMGS
eukprot:4152851-Lingulodinium_polyedra.AAC.1